MYRLSFIVADVFDTKALTSTRLQESGRTTPKRQGQLLAREGSA